LLKKVIFLAFPVIHTNTRENKQYSNRNKIFSPIWEGLSMKKAKKMKAYRKCIKVKLKGEKYSGKKAWQNEFRKAVEACHKKVYKVI
jgi:hypothetical protein